MEFFDGSYRGIGFFMGSAAEVNFGFVLGEMEDTVVSAMSLLGPRSRADGVVETHIPALPPVTM